LWLRSWRHSSSKEDQYSWLAANGNRLTVRSDAGRLTLYEPPTGDADALAKTPVMHFLNSLGVMPTRESVLQSIRSMRSAPDELTARQIAARLRNDQVAWFTTGTHGEDSMYTYAYAAYACESPPFYLSDREEIAWWKPDGTAAPQWLKFSKQDATAALLQAMEDPERFAIAHLLLMQWHGSSTAAFERLEGNRIRCERDGLRFVLTLQDGPDGFWDPSAAYEPDQLPKLREQWHRRLDVARGSVPLWSVTAATAVLPLVWITMFVRHRLVRQSRRQSGRCLVCGYDLRASRGRCPECGTVSA
jgi:hypothetical protein